MDQQPGPGAGIPTGFPRCSAGVVAGCGIPAGKLPHRRRRPGVLLQRRGGIPGWPLAAQRGAMVAARLGVLPGPGYLPDPSLGGRLGGAPREIQRLRQHHQRQVRHPLPVRSAGGAARQRKQRVPRAVPGPGALHRPQRRSDHRPRPAGGQLAGSEDARRRRTATGEVDQLQPWPGTQPLGKRRAEHRRLPDQHPRPHCRQRHLFRPGSHRCPSCGGDLVAGQRQYGQYPLPGQRCRHPHPRCRHHRSLPRRAWRVRAGRLGTVGQLQPHHLAQEPSRRQRRAAAQCPAGRLDHQLHPAQPGFPRRHLEPPGLGGQPAPDALRPDQLGTRLHGRAGRLVDGEIQPFRQRPEVHHRHRRALPAQR